MSYFWERPLHDIRENLLLMSGLVEGALDSAMRALAERNDRLAAEVVAEDAKIDELEIRIDDTVVIFISTNGAVATDMRFVLTASKIANNLERIADEATTIARRVQELSIVPPLKSTFDLPSMASVAQEMLRDAMDAFIGKNPDQAREIITRDKGVDQTYRRIVQSLTADMIEDPKTIKRALNALTIAKSLERVGDHATNIAEEVVYLYEGNDIRHDPARKQ
jgi:phosphate transport system protein